MTKVITTSLILLLSFFVVNSTTAQTYLYADAFGNTGEDVGRDITSDAAGNSYVTGSFEGTVNFGGGGLTSGGDDDIFLVKLDVFGNHVWSKSFGGLETQFVNAIALDPTGNIYLTGHFKNRINFDGGNTLIQSFSGQDVFVVKLDPSGDYIWARSFGENNFDEGNDIAIDLNGNVLVAGSVINDVTFASTTHAGLGNEDAFLVKYDTNGNEIWFRRNGSTSHDSAQGLVMDNVGNAYVVGNYTTTGTFPGFGGKDVFVTRLNPLGTIEWYQRLGGTQVDIGYAIGIDSDANVYVTGSFGGTVDFGGGGITSGGSDDIFILKMDSLGVHDWSSGFGGVANDAGYAIDVDDNSNVYVTGSFSNIVDFGGGGLTSGGSDDIFSIGYSQFGDFIFAERKGGTGSEKGFGVNVNINEDVLLTGTMGSNTNFGGGSKSFNGGSDIFLYFANVALLLPVTLTDFQAEASQQDVTLTWAISADQPYHGFTVERSRGSGDFQSVETIYSPSSTSLSHSLQFSCIDKKITPGIYYYRIKSEDTNGQYTYSNTIQVIVKMTGPGVLDAYFDPQQKKLFIHIIQEEHILGQINLLSFQGQTLQTFSVYGGDRLTIDLHSLPANCYVLKYHDRHYQGVIKVWRY